MRYRDNRAVVDRGVVEIVKAIEIGIDKQSKQVIR